MLWQIARLLLWFHLETVLCQIIHDCAAEFLSNVIQETAQVLGMKQLPPSDGHPQTDGLVEQLNYTLNQMLSKVVEIGTSYQFCLLIKKLLMRLLEKHHSLWCTGEMHGSKLARIFTSQLYYASCGIRICTKAVWWSEESEEASTVTHQEGPGPTEVPAC